ncbi:tyrosine-type recombinase/integrase [Pseudoalteromonas lipolytica]|uniref:tyrosine-type recombinase/integrase n=1 Tax=Pseudoalteromonas lipolytica TaxID=570156 RepID=UPI000826B0E4|nr:site-specific integrase [Pseudoalteromonas lipolytica]
MSSSVNLIYQAINLGSGFAFNNIKNHQHELSDVKVDRREYSYRSDDIIEGFPLLTCKTRFRECMEINLFLMHRYTGQYSTQRSKQSQSNSTFSEGYVASLNGEGLDLKTVITLAKELRYFLDWLEKDGSSYEEVIAAPLSKDSAQDDVKNLPIWRYHEYLCNRVRTKDRQKRLSFSVAQNRIAVVKHFYLWTYKRGIIESIPFSLEYKKLRYSSRNSAAEDTIYSLPTSKSNKGGFYQWVSNLKIPRTIKQKSDSPNQKLQPYSPTELVALLSSEVVAHRTYGTMTKCAYLGGFRAFEIVAIDYNDIFNPTLIENKKRKLQIPIKRKGHKVVNIIVSHSLMSALYNYTLDTEWTKRRLKHEIKYGMNNPEHPLPLFINRSGERMVEATPSNIISLVRKELVKKGKPTLTRTFHDLRSTFGTYLAVYLFERGLSAKEIRLFLRKFMSHESFAVTERYIDFAKVTDLDEFGAMSAWVQDIYNEVNKMIEADNAA